MIVRPPAYSRLCLRMLLNSVDIKFQNYTKFQISKKFENVAFNVTIKFPIYNPSS